MLRPQDHHLQHDNMFYSCTALEGGKGTTYDTDAVDGIYARPDGDNGKPGYFTSTGKPIGTEDVSSSADAAARKLLRNGVLYIECNGRTYTVTGAEVR